MSSLKKHQVVRSKEQDDAIMDRAFVNSMVPTDSNKKLKETNLTKSSTHNKPINKLSNKEKSVKIYGTSKNKTHDLGSNILGASKTESSRNKIAEPIKMYVKHNGKEKPQAESGKNNIKIKKDKIEKDRLDAGRKEKIEKVQERNNDISSYKKSDRHTLNDKKSKDFNKSKSSSHNVEKYKEKLQENVIVKNEASQKVNKIKLDSPRPSKSSSNSRNIKEKSLKIKPDSPKASKSSSNSRNIKEKSLKIKLDSPKPSKSSSNSRNIKEKSLKISKLNSDSKNVSNDLSKSSTSSKNKIKNNTKSTESSKLSSKLNTSNNGNKSKLVTESSRSDELNKSSIITPKYLSKIGENKQNSTAEIKYVEIEQEKENSILNTPHITESNNLSAKEDLDCTSSYEDDFEDYESDFEVDSRSVSTEKRSRETFSNSVSEDEMGEVESMEELSGSEEENRNLDESYANLSKNVYEIDKKVLNFRENVEDSDAIGENIRNVGTYDLNVNKINSNVFVTELYDNNNGQNIKCEISSNKEQYNQAHVHEKDFDTSTDVNENFENKENLTPDMKSHNYNIKNRPKTVKSFVNFARAKEETKNIKTNLKLKTRGEILRNMIQLDSVYFELFNQLPDTYESYITNFGRANYIQASVQTNEDSLEEWVQTDDFDTLNKWTQHPIHISVKKDAPLNREDFIGVGGDAVISDEKFNFKIDSRKLNSFLENTSQVMLMLLEEEVSYGQENERTSAHEVLGFENTDILLGSGISEILRERKCTFASVCPTDPLLLITGYGPGDSLENFVEDLNSTHPNEILTLHHLKFLSLTLVWSSRQPIFSQNILSCRSEPTVARFSPHKPTMVVAGFTDGTLGIWDLREKSYIHPYNVLVDGTKWRVSPPSYITACSLEDSETFNIVQLEVIPAESSAADSFQVVSLSACGVLSWWTVVKEKPSTIESSGTLRAFNSSTEVEETSQVSGVPNISTELGAAPWSIVILSRTSTFNVGSLVTFGTNFFSDSEADGPKRDGLKPGSFRNEDEGICGIAVSYDFKFCVSDPNFIFVAMANGHVLRFSRYNLAEIPVKYVPEFEPSCEVVSISMCPHDSDFFLVGAFDGTIRLHTVKSAKFLTMWRASADPAPVKKVQWSPVRPCVFYMLDQQGIFHIWDLSAGDIHPMLSIDENSLIDGKISDFALAKFEENKVENVCAIFTSDTGQTRIRTVSAQFRTKNKKEYQKELEGFRAYIRII